jgi:hypothetical protein
MSIGRGGGGKGRKKRQGKDNAEKHRERTGAERCAGMVVDKSALMGMVEELEDGVGGAVDGSGGTESVADFG